MAYVRRETSDQPKGKYVRRAAPQQKESEEGPFKSSYRKLLQLPMGLAEAGAGLVDLAELPGKYLGEALGAPEEPSRREQLRNVGRYLEEKTGVPLEAKTSTQQAARLAGFGSPLGPIGLIGGPASYAAAKGLGANEEQAQTTGEVLPAVLNLVKFGVRKGLERLGNRAIQPTEILPPEGPGPRAPLQIEAQAPRIEGSQPSAGPSPLSPEGGPNVEMPRIKTRFEEVLNDIRSGKTGEEGVQGAKSALEQFPGGPQAGGFASDYEAGKAVKKAVQRSAPRMPQVQASTPSKATATALAERPTTGSFTNDVQRVFSPVSFYNPTQGGRAVKNEIMRLDKYMYGDKENPYSVKNLYDKADALNANIVAEYPEALSSLQAFVDEISHPDLNTTEKAAIQSAKKFINEIAEFETVVDEDGNASRQLVGLRPTSNQILLDQIKSWRKKADYDFTHAGAGKNIYKKLISILDESALRAAQSDPQAYDALVEARQAYSDWATIFDNDYVRPFRDQSNHDFEKIFESSLTPDNFNVINNVLQLSGRGQTIGRAMQGRMANQMLAKYKKNPSKYDPEDIENDIRRLEAVISTKQANQLRKIMARRIQETRPHLKPPKLPLEGKTEEQIASMMNRLSGWDEFERLLSNEPQLLKNLKDYKTADILQNGKLTPADSAKPLKELLNDKQSVAVLNRTLGNDRLNALRKLVKEWHDLEIFLDKLSKDEAALARMKIKGEDVSGLAKFFAEIVKKGAHPIKTIQKLVTDVLDANFFDRLFKWSKQSKEVPLSEFTANEMRNLKSTLDEAISVIKD